jgi:thiol-disulfide isomerase/thioredoxin
MSRRNHPQAKFGPGRHGQPKASVQPNKRLLYFGVASAVLVLIAFAVYGLVVPQLSANRTSGIDTAQTPAEVRVGAQAPDMRFTTMDGNQRKLSEFRGQPVMLWLFATWCPSCQAGTEAVAQNFDRLKQAGLQIIQLKLYNNLGYSGPAVADFASRYAGSVSASSRWLWGEASEQGSYTYDSKGYPDIYFLIDKEGVIRAISGAPDATMPQILAFAQNEQ